MMVDERLHLVDGREIAIVRAGPREAPPLLAIHGWLDNAASFIPLMPSLATSHHVVAIDLPGHGLSPHKAPTSFYHFMDWLYDITLVLEALGWEHVHLLGHSLGGAIAAYTAAMYPERVKSLSILDSLLGMAGDPKTMVERTVRHVRERRRLAERHPPRVYADMTAIVRAWRQASPMSEASCRLLLGRSLMPVPGGWVWRSDPMLRVPNPVRLTSSQYEAALSAIRAPCLMLMAKQGLLAEFPQGLTQLVQWVPQAKILALDGGHHVHMDEPALVQGHLSAFLRSFT